MSPFLENWDYIFIYKLAYVNEVPKRGDIVVAYPRQYDTKVIKRVAVLPGEEFEPVPNFRDKLDPGEYFLLGDNLRASVDSRVFGPVDRWDIKGKAIKVFRLKSLTLINI